MHRSPARLPAFQAQLLTEGLRALFGEMNEEILAALTPMLEWVEVAGGETVVRQGDTDRDLYIVISGRLRAYGGIGPERRHERGAPSLGREHRFLNDVTRGETIGEVSFFSGSPRVATVVASRDSLLVRITPASMERLLRDHPQLTLGMARLVIERLSGAGAARRARRRPANLCLLPVTPGIDAQALGQRLVARFPGPGSAFLLTSSALEAQLGVPGIAQADRQQGDAHHQLIRALDELEARHRCVVYVPDQDLATAWSRRCLRMADRILLLAEASASPEVGETEARYLDGADRLTSAEQFLVLLHGENEAIPSRTSDWLERRALRGIAGHLHVRPHRDGDLARLARTQGGASIGLVLCGGGARCLAQLGVYKALQEFGVQVDHVGGSGMGAVMGALIALDTPADELIAYAREAFTANPTGDVSLVPLSALIKGRQLRAILDDAIEQLAGPGVGIEDTWKTYFCVAANYSRAAEVVLRRGSLARSIRASCAVPGLLPPVPVAGELMVDGGAFNNFPTDVMADAGAGKVIGVNIARDAVAEVAFDEIPGNWTLTWDRLTGSRRKYRVPSLMAILMNTATLYSASRERAAESLADLAIRVSLPSVGILDWHAFDHAVDIGYRQARKVLAAMPHEELAPYREQ